MDASLAAVIHEENVHIGRGASKEVEKNQMTQGMQRKSDLHGLGKGNKPFSHILTDEEIKQCSEWDTFGHKLTDDEQIKQCYGWAKDGIWRIEVPFCSEYEENLFMNPYPSDIELAGSEFEEPFMIEKGGYETDEADFKISVPGRLSSVYTQEELDDRLGVHELWMVDYRPLPEFE